MNRLTSCAATVLFALTVASCGSSNSNAAPTAHTKTGDPAATPTTRSSAPPSVPTAAATSSNAATPKPIAFAGAWRTTGGDVEFEAKVSRNHIVVNYLDHTRPSYRELYWDGTFPASESTKVVSVANRAAMSDGMLTSNDRTKAFELVEGRLTFRFVIPDTMDVVVRLKRVS